MLTQEVDGTKPLHVMMMAPIVGMQYPRPITHGDILYHLQEISFYGEGNRASGNPLLINRVMWTVRAGPPLKHSQML